MTTAQHSLLVAFNLGKFTPDDDVSVPFDQESALIRQLKTGQYRIYSRTKDPKTGKRRNLGTFPTRSAAEKHEREIQYFKRQ